MTSRRSCLAAKGLHQSDPSLRNLIAWKDVDEECDCIEHRPFQPREAPLEPPKVTQAIQETLNRCNKKRELAGRFFREEIDLETYENEVAKL